MANFRVDVSSYKKKFGNNDQAHFIFEDEITSILINTLRDFKGEKVEVYNLLGQSHELTEGVKKKRLVVLMNGTRNTSGESYELEDDVILESGKILDDIHVALMMEGKGTLITSENGVVLAEFYPEMCQLNVLFDIFDIKEHENRVEILQYIFGKINEIFTQEIDENSWVQTNNKSDLAERISTYYQSTTESMRNKLIRDVKNTEDSITSLQRDLKIYLDRRINIMKQLVGFEDNSGEAIQRITTDLDLLANHKDIKNILFNEDRMFEIKTNNLIITDDKDRRFIGGQFTIVIDMQNTSVRFFGTEKRKGYWSATDPHPHVSSSGNPCLGNLTSTVAELCSQNEIYALTLLLLDFLQSANTSDPAGRNVIRWQQIDEDGNHVEVNCPTCANCGCHINEDENTTTVYEITWDCDPDDYDDAEYTLGDPIEVCSYCIEDHYNWDEDAEVYYYDCIINECDDEEEGDW